MFYSRNPIIYYYYFFFLRYLLVKISIYLCISRVRDGNNNTKSARVPPSKISPPSPPFRHSSAEFTTLHMIPLDLFVEEIMARVRPYAYRKKDRTTVIEGERRIVKKGGKKNIPPNPRNKYRPPVFGVSIEPRRRSNTAPGQTGFFRPLCYNEGSVSSSFLHYCARYFFPRDKPRAHHHIVSGCYTFTYSPYTY